MNANAIKPENDRRFCYGANCTWFGPIQDVGSTGKYKVKDKTEHFPALMSDSSLPCCPCCGGMLFELPDETNFWMAVQTFEDGAYERPGQLETRKHPGYVAMMKWQQEQKTCFPTAEALAAAYKEATGTAVDMTP